MVNFNKIILAGYLTKNPEVRNVTVNGNTVFIAQSGIATNYKYKDKQEPMFIDFSAYNKLAETLGTYTTKGYPILIEGRLIFRQWEYEGRKYSKHEIIVESFQSLKNKPKDEIEEKDTKNKRTKLKDSNTITEEDIPF